MAISPQPTQPNRLTQTQAEFSINSSNIVDWMGDFADELNAVSSTYLLGVTGTSTTSNSIGTGAKTFTTQTGLGFVVGNTLRLAFDSTNYMTGDVTSYNSGTGSLVVNVTSVLGSGTRTSWTISLAAVGANNASSVSFTPAGNIAATDVQDAIEELDTEKLSSAAGAVTGTNLEDIITAGSIGSVSQIPVITYDVNGRVTATSSAAKITLGTSQNTTSGTSIDFTSIPSTVKRITVMLAGVSTNGTSSYMLQLGAGSVTTTGYLSSGFGWTGGNNGNAITTGILFHGQAPTAATAYNAVMTLTNLTGNTWIASSICNATTGTVQQHFSTGTLTLGGALDRVRLTTIGGTDTFDAGSMNILME